MADTGNRGVNPNTPDYAQQEQDRRAAIESLAELSKKTEELTDHSQNAGKYVNSLNTAMYGLNTAMQGISTISNLAHLALDGFSNAVQSIVGHVGGLVNLVNPGVMDRFQRAFGAFQAQLGTVFLPLLVGLTGIVQSVANALAGLSPQGKSFILFLAGAAAGLTAAVTLGGVFIAVIGSVSGALTAGAVAGEAFGVGLDAATAGLAAVGAVIGAALTGITSIGAAGAGGLGALAVAGGGLQSLTKDLAPFLETLVGAIESAGAAVIPQATAALQKIVPPLMELFSALVQYLPLVSEVIATFAVENLPSLVTAMADLATAVLPLAVIAAKASVEVIKFTAGIVSFVSSLVSAVSRLSPFFNTARSSNKGTVGNAEAPVSVSHTSIEDLYRKSQEQSLLGLQGKQETTKDVMTDQSVINQWAVAFAVQLAATLSNGGANVARNIATGLATAAARSP